MNRKLASCGRRCLILAFCVGHPAFGQGKVKNDNLFVDLGHGVRMEFIHIRAGEFLMGSPKSDGDAREEEKPQHRVKITDDFYLGKYPVTQEQYFAVMGKNPSAHKPAQSMKEYNYITMKLRGMTTARFPVDQTSWFDAMAFCADLTKRDKQRRVFTLPTEAEWEYAARAGTTTIYPFGDEITDLRDYAWFTENSDDRSHEVGTKRPNPWGLYDMHGNVWQWVHDRWGDYPKKDQVDPQGAERGQERVIRGGMYGVTDDNGDGGRLGCRSASRVKGSDDKVDCRVGFRVCIRVQQDHASTDHPPEKARDTELEKLQGVWLAESETDPEGVVAKQVLKGRSLAIEGNKFVRKGNGKTIMEGRLAIDANGKPKALVMIGTAPEAEQVWAVYDVEGDTLKVCYDLLGKGRPADFEAGAAKSVAVYKRQKR